MDDIVVVTSVPLLYMGAVPSGMMYRAEKERSLDRYDLGNDTRALLDLLPAKQTLLVAGDIHMYLRSQLCNSATDACIPQVRAVPNLRGLQPMRGPQPTRGPPPLHAPLSVS